MWLRILFLWAISTKIRPSGHGCLAFRVACLAIWGGPVALPSGWLALTTKTGTAVVFNWEVCLKNKTERQSCITLGYFGAISCYTTSSLLYWIWLSLRVKKILILGRVSPWNSSETNLYISFLYLWNVTFEQALYFKIKKIVQYYV